jgi:hypothetical protein
MPLDDKEQEILAEIERQFYEEDPQLAHAVKNIYRPGRVGVRLSVVGVVAGLAIVIGFFASNTIVAFVGFALLVASATSLVSSLRSRVWDDKDAESEVEQPE